jgi:hypothetical protein
MLTDIKLGDQERNRQICQVKKPHQCKPLYGILTLYSTCMQTLIMTHITYLIVYVRTKYSNLPLFPKVLEQSTA